ncbi:M4 family metallopeptidase [Micromonospora sp. CPCC 206061]|uniref:M4 family metallopeptidase n=1 Tax=Micromonospora sp. CPCC 206061 TaxID=3122410 RepID=UPI002FF3CC55
MRPRVRAAGAGACLALAAIVGAAVIVASNDSNDSEARFVGAGSAARPGETAAAVPAVAPGDPTPSPGGAKAGGRLTSAAALQELRRAGGKQPAVRVVNGRVRTLAAPAGDALKLPLGVPAGASAETTANAFVNRYGSAFGLDAATSTKPAGTATLAGGDTVVRFNQYAGGLPVLGGQVLVTLNRSGGILGASAETAMSPPVSTSARISTAAAQRTAILAVAKELGVEAGTLVPGQTKLWLYDPRLVDGQGAPQLRPTWWVQVYGPGGITGHGLGSALVDAADNKAVLVLSEHRRARNRIVCDMANRPTDLNDVGSYWCSADPAGPAITRTEGGAASSVADVNAAHNFTGQTYDYFASQFGRDSIDGRGMQIRTTVRACHLACPFENAFWDGAQLTFGAGLVADDIVAHEYTHGVTEHTSNLFYAFQSGAINEAFSDIFGEFVDLAHGTDGPRWRIGEEAGIGAIRDMANPELFRHPAYVGGPNYYTGFLDNGGVHINSGVVNKAAQLIADGGSQNGSTVTGIGLAKSAQLWYRVMHLVTTGSGFADVGAAMQSACRQLVGRFGITRADCTQVDNAVTATALFAQPSVPSAAVVDRCNVAGQQPAVRLYQDDIERTGGWIFDRAYWQVIPSGEVPVSWAHSGLRAMYGWMPSAATPGTSGSATMRTPVTIPAGETHFALHYNVPTFNTSTGGLAIEYNAGGGWVALPADPSTPTPTGASTRGYVTASYDVSSLAGQSVRFRFRLARTSLDREWLVDDVRLYQCVAAPSVPRNVTTEWAAGNTSATVTWDRPASGSAVDHYEVSVDGSPNRTNVAPGGDTTSLVLNGLDAARGHIVRVWAVDAAGGRSLPAELRFAVNPPAECTPGSVTVINGKPVPCRRPSF